MKAIKWLFLFSAMFLLFAASAYAANDITLVKTAPDEDGVVLSEYSDGSLHAVFPDGDFCIIEKDGTETSYFADGDVLIERPDGSKTLTEPNGRVYYTDGKGLFKTTDRFGITTQLDPDDTLKVYFEGGEGVMIDDPEKGRYIGTITSVDGLVIIGDDENYTFISPDKETTLTFRDYFYTDEGGHVSFRQETIIESEGEKMIFREGESLYYSLPDGSYIEMTEETCNYYDAESGDYIRADTAEGLFEMDITEDGVRRFFKNGVFEISDSESGDYLIRQLDGTSEMGNRKTGIRKLIKELKAIPPLALQNICGTYRLESYDMDFSVYAENDGVIVEYVHNPEAGPMSYDEETGIAYTNAAGDEITCVFSESGDTIRIDGTADLYVDGRLVTTMQFGAVKK